MIIGHKINTSMFFYHKESNSFTQEISSLGNCLADLTSRLYDDACDEGFVLVSDRTGAEVPVYFSGVDRDIEGDVQCWNFKSASNNPALKDITVAVFND